MSELEAKLRIRVDGKDEVVSFASSSERALQRLSSSAGRELRGVGQELAGIGRQALNAGAALAGIGAGLGLADQARGVIEYRQAIADLASAANTTEDQLGGLRATLNDTARDTNQFAKDLAGALEQFVAKTGDLDTGRKNLELYGRVATATGARVAEVAAVGADMQKLGLQGDQSKALAILSKQSDAGAVELSDLVTQGPRIFSAGASAGMTGEKGLREIGALFQVAMKGTGNVDRASTATEGIFRDLLTYDQHHPGQLGAHGINVFDPKTHQMNDQFEVVEQIIRATKGRQDLLKAVFQEESIRAINPIAQEFRETGGFATLEGFRDVEADATLIGKKFALRNGTAAARIKQSQIAMQRHTDEKMGDTIDNVAKEYAPQLSDLYGSFLDHPLAYLAGGYAGKRVAGKGLEWGAGKLSGLLGGKAGSVASEVAGEAGGDGTRVFVTNWPGGSFAGGEGMGGVASKAAPAAGAAGEAAGFAGSIAEIAAVAAPVAVAALGVAASGYGVYRAFSEAHEYKGIASGQKPAGAAAAYGAGMVDTKKQIEENRREEGEAEYQRGLSALSVWGGGLSPQRAREAHAGFWAGENSPMDVLRQFEEQQDKLRAIATGEEAFGGNENLITSQMEGSDLILGAIRRQNPLWKGMTGKQRAKYLRDLAHSNEGEASVPLPAAKGQLFEDRAGIDSPDFTPEWARGHVDDLDKVFAPGSAAAAGDNAAETDFAKRVKEALNLSFTINIDPDGKAHVTAPDGTSAPKVTANRTVPPQ